jgi:hypothetical protein
MHRGIITDAAVTKSIVGEMANEPDPDTAEFIEYLTELARVCPDAADGLVFLGAPPPSLSRRYRIQILRTLPDRAGVAVFLAAWLMFVEENPGAVVDPAATYEPDFYRSGGEGKVVGPPPAPITTDDLYRAVLLSGMSEEDARQIADDFAPDVNRPGAMWVGDILLYVALLSPEHEDRIREYLKLDGPRMTQELERVRAELAAVERAKSAKSSRPPSDR